LSTACGRFGPQPLGKIEAMTPSASPGLRDLRNRLDIHYHLNAPATISSRIVAPEGTQWIIHADAPRPTPGDYVLQFDGTVSGPRANERRALPDGQYDVLLDVQADGRRQAAHVAVAVRDADATPPDITEMPVLPDRISPNFDARDDVTHLTYRLAKDARVSAYLDA